MLILMACLGFGLVLRKNPQNEWPEIEEEWSSTCRGLEVNALII
jgi:hypothetical protein